MYTPMKTVALVIAPFLLEKLYAEETTPLQEACQETGCYQQSGKGQSLLQLRRTSTFIEDGVRTSGIGSTAPSTARGFKMVQDRSKCCSREMQAFIENLITSEGYVLCHGGGLAGLVVWYDCPDDDPSKDFKSHFQALKDALARAADPAGKCPWLGVAGGACPAHKETCLKTPGAPFPACEDTNQYICCGKDNGYVQNHATIDPPVSQLDKWDCQANPMPIQVYHKEDENKYSVSSLDPGDGTYKELWTIPLDRTSPKMKAKMNSVAVNPVDGIPYATIRIMEGGDETGYIVRFDQNKFEFVARIEDKKDFLEKNIYLGAFGLSGTYYIAGRSNQKDAELELLAIPKIGEYLPFTDKNEAPKLSPQSDSVSYKVLEKVPKGGADIAIANGNFDNTDESEWLFMLNWDFKLVLAKINDADVSGLEPIVLETTFDDAGSEAPRSFGAAWSYRNEVFFSRNNGDGVFHILTDSINLKKKTYSLDKVVDKTTATNNNDGMNCMDAKPPFPGNDCKKPGEFEIDKVDGQCPKGSKPVKVEVEQVANR